MTTNSTNSAPAEELLDAIAPLGDDELAEIDELAELGDDVDDDADDADEVEDQAEDEDVDEYDEDDDDEDGDIELVVLDMAGTTVATASRSPVPSP